MRFDKLKKHRREFQVMAIGIDDGVVELGADILRDRGGLVLLRVFLGAPGERTLTPDYGKFRVRRKTEIAPWVKTLYSAP